jgi:hypothetical protein
MDQYGPHLGCRCWPIWRCTCHRLVIFIRLFGVLRSKGTHESSRIASERPAFCPARPASQLKSGLGARLAVLIATEKGNV